MFEYNGQQYTYAQVEEAARKSNLSIQDYIAKTGLKELTVKEQDQQLGKMTSTAQGAAVEETQAPDMESKSVDTSLVSKEPKKEQLGFLQKTLGKNAVTNFIDDIGFSFMSGYETAQTFDEVQDVMSNISNASDEKIEAYYKATLNSQSIGETDEEKQFNSIYDQELEKGTNGFIAGLIATKESPLGLLYTGVKSFGQMLSTESIYGGLAGAGTGAALGAGYGAAAGAVTGPGAAITTGAGAIAGSARGFFGGVSAVVDTYSTFTELLQEELSKKNLEFTPENIKKVLDDEETSKSIKNRAIGRGLAVGAVDAITFGVASKAGKAAFKTAVKTGRVASNVAMLGAQQAVESSGGALGEVAGRLVAGQEMDSKEIFLEAFAGTGVLTQSPKALANAVNSNRKPQYIINGQEVQRDRAVEFILSAEPQDIAGADIKMKNDPNLFDLAKRKQNKATSSLTEEQLKEVEVKRQENRKKDTEEKVDKSVKFMSKLASVIGVDFEVFENEESYLKALGLERSYRYKGETYSSSELKSIAEEQGKNVEQLISEKETSELVSGGTYSKGKVYINKQGAVQTLQINIGAHEILHPILNALVGKAGLDSPAKIEAQGKLVSEFRDKLSRSERRQMDNIIKQRYDASKGSEKYNTEYFNVFTDAIAKNLIQGDKNLLTKVGDFLKKLFGKYDISLGFDNADQVYNFLKEYTSNAKSGEVSEKIINALDLDRINKDSTSISFSQKSQEQLNERVNSLVGKRNEEGKYEVTKAQYDREGFGRAYQSMIEGDMITPLIRRGIEGDAIYGKPIETFVEDVKMELADVLYRFNPEQNDSLIGFINSQLKYRKQDVINKYKKESGGISIDVEEGQTGFIKELEDMDSGDEFAAFEEEQVLFSPEVQKQFEDSRKIDPRKFFNAPETLEADGEIAKALKMTEQEVEAYNNFNLEEAVADVDLTQTTLANTPRLYDYVVSVSMGINPKKIFDTGITLTSSEFRSGQTFLFNIAQDFLDILPEGSTDKTSGKAQDKFLNKGMNIPNNILKAFYKKEDRLSSDAAGLYPFKLRDDISVKDLLLAFGMDEDGNTLQGINQRSPEAQTVKAAATVLSKLATNSHFVELVEKTDSDPMIIVNLSEGKSDNQYSTDVKESYRNSKRFEDLIKNMGSYKKNLFKSTFGISIEEAYEIAKAANRPNGTQIIDIDKIGPITSGARFIVKALPVEFVEKNKSFVLSILGLHFRENGFQSEFKHNDAENYWLREDTKKFYAYKDKNGKFKEITINSSKEDRLMIEGLLYGKEDYYTDASESNNFLSEEIKGELINFVEKYKNLNVNAANAKKAVTKKGVEGVLERHAYNAKMRELSLLTNKLFKEIFSEESMSKVKDEELKNNLGVLLLQSIKATSNSTEGFRGISTISKKYNNLLVNYSDKEGYQLEHLDANVDVMMDFLNSVLSKDKNRFYSLPEIAFLPKVISKLIDSKGIGLKTASKKDKKSFLDELSKKSESEVKKLIKENVKSAQFSFDAKVDSSAMQFSSEVNDNETRMAGILSRMDKRYNTGQTLDRATARNLAATRAKRRDLLAPSADDFVGLLYRFLDKGRNGEQQYEFLKEKLITPFSRAYYSLNAKRQLLSRQYKSTNKSNKEVVKKLKKDSGFGGFTYEQALRVWLFQKAGYTPNGLNEDTQKALISIVKNNPDLQSYGEQLHDILGITEYWVEPDAKNWQVDTIKSDMVNAVEKVSRKAMLQEWTENKNEIFSGNNMNKIEATYGPDFRTALEDMLYRMENGTARSEGTNKQVNEFLNWIRGSVAVTMFFNTRSALLQQISAVNFINLSDNNPINAAKAVANIDQYAKDIAFIFNSDYLRERRGGLKTDVNAADLADAIRKGGVKGLHGRLLQLGFSLTQIGDSIAISLGGATFYRNRLETYLKKGMDQAAAEKKAFLDFQEISEETQQSARPDRLAKQQTDAVGRIFLAFQNTPMQYTRLTIKAAKDLIAGRGDMKTNISKIATYMIIQNIVFSAMQQAMFSVLFEDDEDENEEKNEKKKLRLINNVIDTFVRGTGMYGAVLSTAKNTILKFAEQEAKQEEGRGRADHAYTMIEALNISPAIGIKAREMYGSIQSYRYNKDKFEEAGFTIENPALDVVGSASAFALNVPLDRAVSKMRNLKAASDAETETWQSIALVLGWNKWNLGIEDEEPKQKKKKSKKIVDKY